MPLPVDTNIRNTFIKSHCTFEKAALLTFWWLESIQVTQTQQYHCCIWLEGNLLANNADGQHSNKTTLSSGWSRVEEFRFACNSMSHRWQGDKQQHFLQEGSGMLLEFALRKWNKYTNKYISFFWEENILSSTIKKNFKSSIAIS